MVKPGKVISILNNLRGHREKLDKLAEFSEADFLRDFTKVESAKHLLQISIESCLDIAHHLVADGGYRTPEDSYDAFVVLNEEKILLAKLGPSAYEVGIKPLRFSAAEGDVVRLAAPNQAAASWIHARHAAALEDAMRAAGRPCRVDIVGATGRIQGELFPGDQPPAPRRSTRFGSLVSRYTFATFVVGGGNQFAHAACKAVSSQPGSHYNPLFLYGGVGLGKTHLANAIGHETLARQPPARVAYLSAESFMTQLIAAISSKRMEEFKATFRKVDVLIVDDVQSLANREGTQEEFFHTFNALHEARRQIVLTSDKVPKDIPALEERLRNRFEWGLIADIQPPDMETRVAIL